MAYDGNRYYDPSAGRFTQEDPIGLAGGLNLYGYAGADPANNSDPFGLCCFEVAVRTAMFVATMATSHPDFIRWETSKNISEHGKQIVEAVKGLTENEESLEGANTQNIIKDMKTSLNIWKDAEPSLTTAAEGAMSKALLGGALQFLWAKPMGDPEAGAAWKKDHPTPPKKDPSKKDP